MATVNTEKQMQLDNQVAGTSKEAEGSTKTIILSTDDHWLEVGATGGKGIERNLVLRNQVFRFISQSLDNIIKNTKAEKETIDLGNQAAIILYIIHTKNRLRAQGKMLNKIGTEYSIISLNKRYTLKKEEIERIVLACAQDNHLEYKKIDPYDPNNWYGIANLYLDMIVGFKYRLDELKYGHNTMILNVSAMKTIKLSDYGIYNSHHILCEGVRFHPQKRLSLAHSLGPATQLMCFLTTIPRYEKKWKNACLRSFSHFDRIEEVLLALQGKRPSEIKRLITIMMDLAVLSKTRQASSIYFPALAFKNLSVVQTYRIGSTDYQMTDTFYHLKKSGKGAFLFYKIMSAGKYELEGNFTESQARQLVYHACFGTFYEDFGFLKTITTEDKWYNREEFGDSLKRERTSDKSRSFQPIEQVYYFKLAQASQTQRIVSANRNSQTMSISVFSGIRKRKYSEAFFTQINSGEIQRGVELESMISVYESEIQRITNKINNQNLQDSDTIEWYAMDSLNHFDSCPTPVDVKVEYFTDYPNRFI